MRTFRFRTKSSVKKYCNYKIRGYLSLAKTIYRKSKPSFTTHLQHPEVVGLRPAVSVINVPVFNEPSQSIVPVMEVPV